MFNDIILLLWVFFIYLQNNLFEKVDGATSWGWQGLQNTGKLNHFSLFLQMKGPWESNINVWFRFMHSQKWNCLALLFPKQNYNFLSPNFHIHISVNDLYIPRIVLYIFLQPNRQTDPENIYIAHRYMKVGIGNEAAQFHFWEYINLIFGTVYLKKQIKEFNTRIAHTYK